MSTSARIVSLLLILVFPEVREDRGGKGMMAASICLKIR